jgi:hypothetical protein
MPQAQGNIVHSSIPKLTIRLPARSDLPHDRIASLQGVNAVAEYFLVYTSPQTGDDVWKWPTPLPSR